MLQIPSTMRPYKKNTPIPPIPRIVNVAQPTCILPPLPVNGRVVVLVVFVVFGEEREEVEEVLGMAYGAGGAVGYEGGVEH